ncbi:MAG: hypothetical protein KIS92_20350, partial [Planctomycetota bacterium]|nr:hypothetical protein [Planctomycetota bacterium]
MPARYSYPLAVLCGIVMSLPFSDVWAFPAWIGLAPVLYLVAEAPTARRAAGLAYAFALVWSLLCFRFFLHWSPVGWVALGLFTSAFYLAALLSVRALARRGIAGAVFGSAAVWVLAEIARSRIPVVGFPWMLLGHAAADDANLRQLADLAGVYGLSFLAAAVNAALAFVAAPLAGETLAGPPGTPVRRRLCASLVAAGLLAALAYGDAQTGRLGARMRAGPRIAMLQGCSYQKIDRSNEEKQQQLDEHLLMHAEAAA